ncbi:O-antigen ligase family protein [Chrysiogenes arsenatis]|uniref:O-antigen ligase family protein n=1 Tax=Chrysiogenes arsenatis TaxID=309797 RepID=UPI00041020C8|nr:O-antigen ligase family protein [Chrysiogenes arsenatis]
MFANALQSTQQRVEVFFLCMLLLVLPLAEAPKNIAWMLFVIAWLWGMRSEPDRLFRWDFWDNVFACFILASAFSAFFASVSDAQWGGFLDVLRYTLVGWMLARSHYKIRTYVLLLQCVVAGTIIALIHGYWNFVFTGKRGVLQLHSVGHVNHSAIYLALSFAVLMAFVFWYVRQPDVVKRFGFWGFMTCCLFYGVSLLEMASRGAILAFAVFWVLVVIAWFRVSFKQAAMASVLSVIIMAGFIIAIPHATAKFLQMGVAGSEGFSHRDRLANVAYEGWRENPVAGVGMGNFRHITLELIALRKEQRGEVFDPERYLGSNHAHSLYMNTLAEKGILGFSALLFLIIVWAGSLWKKRNLLYLSDQRLIVWLSAVGGLVVTFVSGLFNTSLHTEHGILSMVLFGVWVGLFREANQ